MSGALNIIGGTTRGLLVAGGGNVALGNVDVGQVAGGVNVGVGMNRGALIAPINVHNDVQGLQIGVINIADELDGPQVSVINIANS